jgi:hypothetical protein
LTRFPMGHLHIGKDSRPQKFYYKMDMEQKDLEFIQGMARLEKQIRSLKTGDHLFVKAEGGEISGSVEKINEGDPEKGNHVVIIDAPVPTRRSRKVYNDTVTIDYEGAFGSGYDYYVPYITATADDRVLGDVEIIEIHDGVQE